jgi:hypothetical protein
MSQDAEKIERLLVAWDNLDSAAQRVLCSLPSQMTTAAERLNDERLAFRAVITAFVRDEVKPR